MELADILNQGLGSAQHITQEQASQLTKFFGDVQLLIDLLAIPANSLNTVLKVNTSLDAVQIVAMRCWLNSDAST